jgi:hypothetical protein
MNRVEKIVKWLVEQGYRGTDTNCVAVYMNRAGQATISASVGPTGLAFDIEEPVIGVFRGSEFIEIPEFVDDNFFKIKSPNPVENMCEMAKLSLRLQEVDEKLRFIHDRLNRLEEKDLTTKF